MKYTVSKSGSEKMDRGTDHGGHQDVFAAKGIQGITVEQDEDAKGDENRGRDSVLLHDSICDGLK